MAAIATISADEALRELDRYDCEESLAHFLRTGWRWIDPAPFVDGWAIDAICEHLQAVCDGEIRNLIINIPPRSLKSTLCSISFPAWVWAQRFSSHTSGPGVKFLHASYADRLSVRDSTHCRRIIESPWYQNLWGGRYVLRKDQNAKHRFGNDKGGERLITSIGAGVTGEGGDCFVSGTLVGTPAGPKRIEDICAGDCVVAFDHSRGKAVISRVLATREINRDDIYEICSVQGHSVRCTADHPIFSPGRGYIRASELGRGDWLLIGNVLQEPRKAALSHDLRQLREDGTQAIVRGSQVSEAGQPRRLLQHRMLASAPRSKEQHKHLQALRSIGAGSSHPLLFEGVQKRSHRSESTCSLADYVSAMRAAVLGKIEALFSCVRRSGSFSAHGWRPQFSVCGAGQVFQSVSANERHNSGPRWHELFGLWCSSDADASRQWWLADQPASPPSRREHEEQLPGEPDYFVRPMPHETSSGRFTAVASVDRLSLGPQRVYDIQVETQGNFFANGILAHNCIIVDDPNMTQAMEKEKAAAPEDVIEWWDGTMPTRRNNQMLSARIIIQQRVGENDLTGHILEKSIGEWVHVCVPMRFEADRSFVTSIGWQDPRAESGEELFWEERFPEAEVRALERDLGPWRTAGQLQQRPEPKGGGIIKRDWWRLWERPNLPPREFVLASLDTAYTEKQENDFSAMTVWGTFTDMETASAMQPMALRRDGIMAEVQRVDRRRADQHPGVLLMDAWQERLEINALVNKVAATCKRHKVDKLLIENKAAGISVAQELRRLFQNEQFTVQLVDPRSADKVARLYAIQPLFAPAMDVAGNAIVWPQGHPLEGQPKSPGCVWASNTIWSEMTISQVSTFPKGKHDDLVDSVSQALNHLRMLGMLKRNEEWAAEIEASTQYQGRPPPPIYPV